MPGINLVHTPAPAPVPWCSGSNSSKSASRPLAHDGEEARAIFNFGIGGGLAAVPVVDPRRRRRDHLELDQNPSVWRHTAVGPPRRERHADAAGGGPVRHDGILVRDAEAVLAELAATQRPRSASLMLMAEARRRLVHGALDEGHGECRRRLEMSEADGTRADADAASSDSGSEVKQMSC